MKKNIPGPLWVAIVALGIISLLTLLSVRKGSVLVPLVAVVCNIALLLGLVRGHKWAYVLTIVFSVLGVAVGFAKSPSYGLAILLGNGLVLLPVLICTRYFFPVEDVDQTP